MKTKRRQMSREQWIQLGDDVKAAKALLHKITIAAGRDVGQAEGDRWDRLASRLDALKSKLDGAVHRQHPDWPRAGDVFYGPRPGPPDDLVEVPCCGARPSDLPPGYRDLYDGPGGKSVTPEKMVRQFAAWVEEGKRQGAVMFLAKAVAIGRDGRPV